MIRLYDNPAPVTVVEEPVQAECPTCCGNGEIFVARLTGRNAPVPYATRACGACGGTGLVSAEWVQECAQPSCGLPFWAGTGCEHGPDSPLCPDHAPVSCRECVDERGGLDR